MKKLIIGTLALSALVGITAAVYAGTHGSKHTHRILGFGTMYGVDGPFVGATNSISTLPGDELPWVIKGGAKGFVNSDGHLSIHVHGLVFSDDPIVPVHLQGTNDEAEFRAVLSCLTEDSAHNVVTVNVTTHGFKASPSGDCNIDAQLTLPDPCIAPMVFVTAGSEDKWFAVNGAESED